jgi:5-methylcytosine-specific restriction endonuclease McrA
MRLYKKRRTKDKIFLKKMQEVGCVACGATPPVDACHIKSRGAGGGDDWFNIIPMCRKCHTEQHTIGWIQFTKKYSHVNEHLKLLGWENHSGKLINANSTM